MVLRIRGARDESFRNEWLRERQIKKGSKKNKKGKYNRMEKEGGSVAGLKEREREGEIRLYLLLSSYSTL